MMMSQPLPQTDLFGMVFEDHSSSALRRAKTSAAQTPKAKASKASVAASTSKPSASSESAVLVGSLLKTALISELGALTPSSLRWKHSATPAGRSWFVLETSAPTTSGPEAGSSDATLHKLPTPMASDGMKDGAGGGAGSTYPFRKILGTPTIKSTPRSSAFSEGRVAVTDRGIARDLAHPDQAGQADGCMVPGVRQEEITDDGRGAGRGDAGPSIGQMAVRTADCGRVAEWRTDWSLDDLAAHLQLDDGLSAWVAGTRIAVGGPKGTSAASLIVEAFGDAVVPQIPEAIGRAILRTERALAEVYGRGATTRTRDTDNG
jgi:hypothetical protein